jgi:hypothetical protein
MNLNQAAAMHFFLSIAVTKPQKLSGRSKTTSGQPEQLLLRPSAKGRI